MIGFYLSDRGVCVRKTVGPAGRDAARKYKVMVVLLWTLSARSPAHTRHCPRRSAVSQSSRTISTLPLSSVLLAYSTAAQPTPVQAPRRAEARYSRVQSAPFKPFAHGLDAVGVFCCSLLAYSLTYLAILASPACGVMPWLSSMRTCHKRKVT